MVVVKGAIGVIAVDLDGAVALTGLCDERTGRVVEDEASIAYEINCARDDDEYLAIAAVVREIEWAEYAETRDVVSNGDCLAVEAWKAT